MQTLFAVVVPTKIALFNFVIVGIITVMTFGVVVAFRGLLAQFEDWMVIDYDVVLGADSEFLHHCV